MIPYVRKKLPDSILRSCNYTFQGIPFLQVNAQYPSRHTKLIVIKCFLGRLRPCDSPLSQKYIEIFYIQRIYLLLIESSLCSSLDPLFHSDSIIKSGRCRRNECIFILLRNKKVKKKK